MHKIQNKLLPVNSNQRYNAYLKELVSRVCCHVVVPEILLKGKWLEEAGFKPNQTVQIEQRKIN